jgi:hypothetical protein
MEEAKKSRKKYNIKNPANSPYLVIIYILPKHDNIINFYYPYLSTALSNMINSSFTRN